MNRKPIFFGAALIGCVGVALILVVASTQNAGEVGLESRASEPIDQAIVVVCGQRLDFSDVALGETKSAKFKVRGDSSYEVSIAFHSGRKINATVGYVTNGINYKDKLVVTDNEVVLEAGPAQPAAPY